MHACMLTFQHAYVTNAYTGILLSHRHVHTCNPQSPPQEPVHETRTPLLQPQIFTQHAHGELVPEPLASREPRVPEEVSQETLQQLLEQRLLHAFKEADEETQRQPYQDVWGVEGTQGTEVETSRFDREFQERWGERSEEQVCVCVCVFVYV
jgi:hypothetical protein